MQERTLRSPGRREDINVPVQAIPPHASERKETDLPTRAVPPHPRDRMALAVLGAAGLGLLVLAFVLARGWEGYRAQARFEEVAENYRAALQRQIDQQLEALHHLGSLFRASRLVERREFRIFAEDVRTRHPAIYSLQWRERVARAGRAAFEARVQAEGFRGYMIKDASPDGRFTRAPERAEYFPIVYAEPLAANRSVLGLDRVNEPRRLAALQQAISGRSAVSTSAVQLLERLNDPTASYALLLLSPVYRAAPNDGPDTELMGLGVMILDLRPWVESSLQDLRPAGIDFVVLEEDAGHLPRELYYHRSSPAVGPTPVAWQGHQGLRYTTELGAGDRTLSVVFLATRAYAGTAWQWQTAALLVTIALTLALSGSLLWVSQRRAGQTRQLLHQLSEEVVERTRMELSLRGSERRLQRQNSALAELTCIRIPGFTSIKAALRSLTEIAAATLEVERVGIWLYEERDSRIRCRDLYEQHGGSHTSGQEVAIADYPVYFGAVAEARILAADEAQTDPRTRDIAADYLIPLGITSILEAPIRQGGRMAGIVFYDHRGPARHWTPDEQIFAGSIADLSALVLEIGERRQAQTALRLAHDALESRVARRTRELARANERLQGLDRLKSMFIASMSHELRTPLNAIIGFTGIVLQGLSGELSPKQRDHLGRAYASARHLLDLISDVIDISKIEAGYTEVHTESFALRVLLDEALASIQAQAGAKGLAPSVTACADVEVHSDRKRLLQCVLNLLSNAVKYTDRGGVTLSATVIDGRLEIRVQDTGIGLTPAALERLFQPFERIDSHLRIGTPGTGLGLYLTRKIACELLRGEVRAESIASAGSIFTLCLPLQLAEAKPSARPDSTIGEYGHGKARIGH
ncbi:MAG: CHASE domain-containing sensor histidine kinase [Gammaproteobacteria bacterium]